MLCKERQRDKEGMFTSILASQNSTLWSYGHLVHIYKYMCGFQFKAYFETYQDSTNAL